MNEEVKTYLHGYDPLPVKGVKADIRNLSIELPVQKGSIPKELFGEDVNHLKVCGLSNMIVLRDKLTEMIQAFEKDIEERNR